MASLSVGSSWVTCIRMPLVPSSLESRFDFRVQSLEFRVRARISDWRCGLQGWGIRAHSLSSVNFKTFNPKPYLSCHGTFTAAKTISAVVKRETTAFGLTSRHANFGGRKRLFLIYTLLEYVYMYICIYILVSIFFSIFPI